MARRLVSANTAKLALLACELLRAGTLKASQATILYRKPQWRKTSLLAQQINFIWMVLVSVPNVQRLSHVFLTITCLQMLLNGKCHIFITQVITAMELVSERRK